MRQGHRWFYSGMVAFIASLIATGSASTQEKFNLTALGSGATGIMAGMNAGVAAAVQAAYPGATITYQPSGAGIANIASVNLGRAPLAYAADAELALAIEGRAPFREKVTSFRAIANLVTGVGLHIVVTKDVAERHKLKDFSDLAKNKAAVRIVSNTRGNVVSMLADDFLKEIGITQATIREWGGEHIYVPSQEHASLFADRRADVMMNFTNVRSASMVETMKTRDVVMLTIDRNLVDRVAERNGLQTMTIPASAYDFMADDLYTAQLGVVLIAHESVSDDHAYAITKALVEHTEKFQAAHPAFRATTPEFMASLKAAPYHPGAARLYREKGLMK